MQERIPLFVTGIPFKKTIGGDPATTFSWSPTDEVSDPTSYNPFLSPTTPTTYIINIGNAGIQLYRYYFC